MSVPTIYDGGLVVLDDTWSWDGVAWTELNVPGPSARESAAGTIFEGNVLLSGGTGGGEDGLEQPEPGDDHLRADTWTFDGAAWKEVSTLTPLFSPALATLGSNAVLVGGSQTPGVDDVTWLWDGVSWSASAATGLNQRYAAAMCALGSTIVLFGGFGESTANTLALYADTWIWDGAVWTEQPVSGPSARSSAMARLGNALVLFGGEGAGTELRNEGALGDTWTWDGTSWTQLDATGPSPRSYASMASLNGTIVLFGGVDRDGKYLAETWVWDGTAWTQHDVPGPGARRHPMMVGD